jgi:hypothetical protein
VSTDTGADLAAHVAHDEFRAGLPHGRFHVVVDRKLARGYVGQRLWLLPVVLPMLGVGLALALSGVTWPGALLVLAGFVLHRAVAWNAGKILLHLALKDATVYGYATQNGIMEVRRV